MLVLPCAQGRGREEGLEYPPPARLLPTARALRMFLLNLTFVLVLRHGVWRWMGAYTCTHCYLVGTLNTLIRCCVITSTINELSYRFEFLKLDILETYYAVTKTRSFRPLTPPSLIIPIETVVCQYHSDFVFHTLGPLLLLVGRHQADRRFRSRERQQPPGRQVLAG